MLELSDYVMLHYAMSLLIGVLMGMLLVGALEGGSGSSVSPHANVTMCFTSIMDANLRAFCEAKGFDVFDVEYRTDSYYDITCHEEKDGWIRLGHFSKEEFDAWLTEASKKEVRK